MQTYHIDIKAYTENEALSRKLRTCDYSHTLMKKGDTPRIAPNGKVFSTSYCKAPPWGYTLEQCPKFVGLKKYIDDFFKDSDDGKEGREITTLELIYEYWTPPIAHDLEEGKCDLVIAPDGIAYRKKSLLQYLRLENTTYRSPWTRDEWKPPFALIHPAALLELTDRINNTPHVPPSRAAITVNKENHKHSSVSSRLGVITCRCIPQHTSLVWRLHLMLCLVIPLAFFGYYLLLSHATYPSHKATPTSQYYTQGMSSKNP